METIAHSFKVTAGGNNYILTVEKPLVRVVSSEYYFTYPRTAGVSVRPIGAEVNIHCGPDRFMPLAYMPDQLKFAVVRFNRSRPPARSALKRLVEAVASCSTQFPAMVLENRVTRPAVERVIETLVPLVERYDMYFLLLLRMAEVPEDMDPVFLAHREVYYSSRNRIYLKCLLCAEGDSLLQRLGNLKERGIAADVSLSVGDTDAPPPLADLSPLIDSWRDTYSEQDIHQGPNVWIELKHRVKPDVLLDLDAALAGAGVRRFYFHPSLHRLLNGYATLHPGGINGTLVFGMDGTLTVEDLGKTQALGSWMDEDMEELLSRLPAGCCGSGNDETPCGELCYFCARSPLHCDFIQDVVNAMARRGAHAYKP